MNVAMQRLKRAPICTETFSLPPENNETVMGIELWSECLNKLHPTGYYLAYTIRGPVIHPIRIARLSELTHSAWLSMTLDRGKSSV
jgi:hypothetical protein